MERSICATPVAANTGRIDTQADQRKKRIAA
jgi:hypothetical protein